MNTDDKYHVFCIAVPVPSRFYRDAGVPFAGSMLPGVCRDPVAGNAPGLCDRSNNKPYALINPDRVPITGIPATGSVCPRPNDCLSAAAFLLDLVARGVLGMN